MSNNKRSNTKNEKAAEEDYEDINSISLRGNDKNLGENNANRFIKNKHRREEDSNEIKIVKTNKHQKNIKVKIKKEKEIIEINEDFLNLENMEDDIDLVSKNPIKSNIDPSNSFQNTYLNNLILQNEKIPSFFPARSQIEGKYSPFYKKSYTPLSQDMDDFRNTFPTNKSLYSRGKQHEFIKKALELIKCEDEMLVLNALCDLSSELSMANDSLAEDSNCTILIKELISLFDKFYGLPDISMSSLTCINYLLDLNPRYTSSIIKYGGVGKIVNMTQNIEYIDCAESAIKVIEKMSYENPFAVIENDAFVAVLSLIDFFDLNLRKSALKACVNMTKALNNMDYIKKFILPAVPSLTNLAKYSGNTELEKTIVDLAVQCFYNVAYYFRIYNLATNHNNFCNSLIQFNLLENLFELFVKFLGEVEGSDIKFSQNILVDTFKNILRLFEVLCSLSADTTNLLLNMNILEIIYNILSKELEGEVRANTSNTSNKKLFSNSTSCYLELFSLLISFFPNKKSKQSDRLLAHFNKNFFTYFSEKILSLLINNVVNIPSSNTMVSLMKLLKMYIENSPVEQIVIYINPVKFSNIAGKMLDSKDSSYITEVFNVVEIIMNKVPEHFFVSLLREGVVDHIRNLIEVEESQLYIPVDAASKHADYTQLKEKYQHAYGANTTTVNANNAKLDEIYIEDEEDSDDGGDNELMNEGYESNITNTEKKVLSRNITEDKIEKLSNLDNLNAVNEAFYIKFLNKDEQSIEKNPSNQNLTNYDSNFPLLDTKTSLSNYIKNKIYQKSQNNTSNVVINSPKKADEQVDSLNANNIIKNPAKKLSQNISLVATIQVRAKEISDKFFSDEDINKLLIKTNSQVNPKEIIQKLNNIKEILKNPEQVDLNVLVYLFDLIFDQNKITFFEIEKSEIMFFLTKFIDVNFIANYFNTAESESKSTYNISGKYNTKIISHLKMLFNAMNNDSDRINEFIKILQLCISSMNCFKLFLYDVGSLKNASHLFLSSIKNQIPKIRMKFVYCPSDESMNRLLLDDNPIFKETYEYFLNKKFVSLTFDQTDSFEQVKCALVKYRSKIKESINTGNSLTKENSSLKDDYYEEIFNQLRNRKGSEEDIGLTEKLLQKLIDRKKSSDNSDVIGNNNNIIIEGEVNDNQELLLELLDINFFVIINNIRMDISKDLNVKDFFKELKSFYKRADYLQFSNEMQINFDITYKNNQIIDINKGNEDLTSNDEFAYTLTCNIEKNLEIISRGDYESLLFEKYYRDNIINNKSLYCIKRACPFIFLISLLELSVNNFGHLFNLRAKIPQETLENLKMTSLLFKQVKDPYAISSLNVPSWCNLVCQSFTYLSGFNSRYLLFKVSSFETKRSMTNLYVYLKNYMGENVLEDKTLNQSKRLKLKVDRENIIRDSEKMMKDNQSFNGYLEFEYHDETGTGIGPTFEFYSLVVKEMKKMSKLWYKTSDHSLFPAPVDSSNLTLVDENKRMFTLLGYVIARGLYDDRLLDFALNSLFWDLVLDRPVSLEKINKIDKDLGKAVVDFTQIIEDKKKVKKSIRKEDSSSNSSDRIDLNDYVKYNNFKVEDMQLTFNVPGYNEIELKRGASDELVTINNIEEYVALLFDRIVLNGTKDFTEAFKSGFNSVFPIDSLKCFTSTELEEVICGCSSESWDYDVLVENIIPSHGYDKNSLIFKGLLEILKKMNNLEKKKFLLFVTGSPRLPIGGFKSLNPKMTVVKKQPELLREEGHDGYLPTVMTCQNYLKVPEYTSTKVLKEKLFLAMEEGGNAFHLS